MNAVYEAHISAASHDHGVPYESQGSVFFTTLDKAREFALKQLDTTPEMDPYSIEGQIEFYAQKRKMVSVIRHDLIA